jgi:hypothetical protein
MSRSIRAYVYKATKAELQVAKNLLSVLSKGLGLEEIPIDDVYSVNPDHADVAICFGGFIQDDVTAGVNKVVKLPGLPMLIKNEKNIHTRQITFNTITQLVSELQQPEEPPTEAFIETPAGIKVGRAGLDINITAEEANYLKQIRDLLGGGKMVITKGDLRIEVEG